MLAYHPGVPPTITITPDVARRFLAIRHFLAPPRALPAEPASVMAVVERIGSLQFDPLEVAGRNHDLVLLSRIAGYRRAWTDALLYEDRALFEAYNKGFSLLPTTELPFYRVTWDRNRAEMEAGVRPIIRLASSPTAWTSPVCSSTATTDGSETTIPSPLT